MISFDKVLTVVLVIICFLGLAMVYSPCSAFSAAELPMHSVDSKAMSRFIALVKEADYEVLGIARDDYNHYAIWVQKGEYCGTVFYIPQINDILILSCEEGYSVYMNGLANDEYTQRAEEGAGQ